MEQQTREQQLKSQFSALNFGTSGIRSLITNMTDMECYINTRGFIKYLIEIKEIRVGSKIAIGGDLRNSTPRIMSAIHKAILDENCQTVYCGFVPTPTLSYYAWNRKLPAIMITGSHIPDDRNGIKFIKSFEEVLKSDEKDILRNVEIARTEEYEKNETESLFNMNGKFKNPIELPSVSEEEVALKEFQDRYTCLFPSDILKNKKILIYEQSAVGRDLLKNILTSLGAEVIGVERSNIFIPIDTEKIPEYVSELFKKLANEYNPFAIVSTDGDSDRPILVDENGSFLPGDLLGLLVSLYLKPDFVSIPVSSNDAAISTLNNLNVELVLTKIGSPYCIEAMNTKLSENSNSKVVSWERNGGYLLGNDWTINNHLIKSLPTRDSILPILISLIFSIEENMSLSNLIDTKLPHRVIVSDAVDDKTYGCEKYTSELGKIIINNFSIKNSNIQQIDFKDTIEIIPKQLITEDIQNEAKTIKSNLESYFTPALGYQQIKSINYIDGVRICFSNNDVVHLRPSSNASEFRLYVTSDTEEQAHKILTDRFTIIPNIISDVIKNQ